MAFDIHFSLGQSLSLKPITDGTPVAKPAFRKSWGWPSHNGGICEGQYDLGASNDPSGWHSFAKLRGELTGIEAVYLNMGATGSGLLQASASSAGHFWDSRVTGGLYESRQTMLAEFEAVLSRSPRFVGTGRRFVHWDQGTRDANALNGVDVTGALYQDALEALVEQALADYQADKFLIGLLGMNSTNPTGAAHAEIRAAQLAVAAAHPQVEVIFDKGTDGVNDLVTDTSGEWVSGWGYVDADHYTGPAYKASGMLMARNLTALLDAV